MASGERKRRWTRSELLEKTKQCETLLEAADDICNQMRSGHEDMEDSEIGQKFVDTSKLVASRLSKLVQEMKKKNFRHHPSQLEEKALSASEYSFFDSQESQTSSLDMFADEMGANLPTEYNKRPLHSLSRQSIRKRIKDERELFGNWCKDQKCSVAQLAGLFIHLEYYQKDRKVAQLGFLVGIYLLKKGQPSKKMSVIWKDYG